MEYEKPSQTAQRLNVTSRAIQKWAVDGRIPGAVKIADHWLIPKTFEKPLTKSQARPSESSVPPRTPPTLLNQTFPSGCCQEYINSITNENERIVATAEYNFYAGDADHAAEILEPLLDCEDAYIRDTALLIYSYANLSRGHIHLASISLSLLKKSSEKYESMSVLPQIRALHIWNAHTLAVLVRDNEDDLEPLENWIRYLPGGMRLFACYMIAHKMYLQGKFQGAHAVSKISVDLCLDRYVIPEIYCKIIDAISLMNLKHISEAEEQFLSAWKLAKADSFLEPFAEHYQYLQGLADRCLKNQYPEDYKKLTEIATLFANHWSALRSINNNYPKINFSVTELTIAVMYTRDWTAKEIADHLDMSVRTVYRHISNIYDALGIRNVAELKKYVAN